MKASLQELEQRLASSSSESQAKQAKDQARDQRMADLEATLTSLRASAAKDADEATKAREDTEGARAKTAAAEAEADGLRKKVEELLGAVSAREEELEQAKVTMTKLSEVYATPTTHSTAAEPNLGPWSSRVCVLFGAGAAGVTVSPCIIGSSLKASPLVGIFLTDRESCLESSFACDGLSAFN